MGEPVRVCTEVRWTHTQTHTVCAWMGLRVHGWACASMYVGEMDTHTHTHTRARTHTQTCTLTLTHTHAAHLTQTNTLVGGHTHTCTHTDTHGTPHADRYPCGWPQQRAEGVR
jgi:hypothetical protein